MMMKRTALALLCSLMLMTGTPAPARQVRGRSTLPARTKKRSKRARVTPRIILPAEDEFTRKETFRGLIISAEAGSFTLRDGRGLDTVVLLFPDTLYRIGKAPGALTGTDKSVIRPGITVTVEGLLNSSYRMKANVVTADGY